MLGLGVQSAESNNYVLLPLFLFINSFDDFYLFYNVS